MITTPEELIDTLESFLTLHKKDLGIETIAYHQERLIPKFPAIQITAGPVDRAIHGTRTYNVELTADIWVMHAKLTDSYRTRTKKDMELATQIWNLLKGNVNDPEDRRTAQTLGGVIVHGFVAHQIPGIAAAPHSDAIIATQLHYTALTQERF